MTQARHKRCTHCNATHFTLGDVCDVDECGGELIVRDDLPEANADSPTWAHLDVTHCTLCGCSCNKGLTWTSGDVCGPCAEMPHADKIATRRLNQTLAQQRRLAIELPSAIAAAMVLAELTRRALGDGTVSRHSFEVHTDDAARVAAEVAGKLKRETHAASAGDAPGYSDNPPEV